jgi:uncharacterized membrane protein
MELANVRSPLLVAVVLLGVGLGGFVDGIVLHQILQWHHLVSEPYPPETLDNLKLNTLFDGLFHAFTWMMTAMGLALLWRASKQPGVLWSTRALMGSLAIGWGLFNLVEGIVDHHVLEIHHVRAGPNQLAWDVAFLAFGAVLVVGGWALARSRTRQEDMTQASGVRGT